MQIPHSIAKKLSVMWWDIRESYAEGWIRGKLSNQSEVFGLNVAYFPLAFLGAFPDAYHPKTEFSEEHTR